MTIHFISQTAGIIGVILILVTYFLLNKGVMRSDVIIYPLLNLIGSSLLLFSLIYSWNLPSVIIEIFWMSISLYGIYNVTQKKRKAFKEKMV